MIEEDRYWLSNASLDMKYDNHGTEREREREIVTAVITQ